MKHAILYIAPVFLLPFLVLGKHKYEVIADPLPSDVRLDRTFYDAERDLIGLVLHSESFDEVPPGGLLPQLKSPTFSVDSPGLREYLESLPPPLEGFITNLPEVVE